MGRITLVKIPSPPPSLPTDMTKNPPMLRKVDDEHLFKLLFSVERYTISFLICFQIHASPFQIRTNCTRFPYKMNSF